MNKKMRELLAQIEKATNEAKSFRDEKKFDDAQAKLDEVAKLKKEYEIEKSLFEAEQSNVPDEPAAAKSAEPTQEEKDRKAFKGFILGQVATMKTGEQNLNSTNAASVIPTTIAQQVISAVKEVCPIYAKATIYHAKGTLKIPVWGNANTTHNINVAYSDEFTELTADSGKFTSVDLTGYLVGALTLIGKSEVNNADLDVVDFVVKEMAKKIGYFIENELINGTSGKCTGALSSTTSLTTASATAITADELIDLQAKIPTIYQANACFVMAPATFTAIRKLKDSQNRYMLETNFSNEFPYMLLGKPVYLSDNMPAVAAGAKTVLYADFSGLSVNLREDISIEVLREKYATQHALGVNAWFEIDSKIADNQKIAVLVQKAS